MMVSDQSDWIKRDLGFEEHLADDPFHATLIARYDYQDRKLEDRIALLEEIIKVLRREIKELNHQLKNYRGLDVSALSNVDFWLTEEDDIWDTL